MEIYPNPPMDVVKTKKEYVYFWSHVSETIITNVVSISTFTGERYEGHKMITARGVDTVLHHLDDERSDPNVVENYL
jgi:hypothetical protein